MRQAPLENVIAHWAQLVEYFETSTLDFYADVGRALNRRAIKGVKTTEFEWNEGGALAPRRTYLRISADRLEFHLCAAPFGNGYFFSWWLLRRPPSFVPLYWLLMLAGMFVVARATFQPVQELLHVASHVAEWLMWSPWPSILLTLILAPLMVLWAAAVIAALGLRGPEDAVLATPFIGSLYCRVFAPVTFYRLDTEGMFRASVHAAVLETIDGLPKANGVRALAADERKPVFDRLS